MPAIDATPACDTRVSLALLRQPRYATGRLIEAGMSEPEAVAKGKRFAQAARRLIEGGRGQDETAVACFVPGRIEVLGKHTDYCGGRSLLCTVERGMCFVAVGNSGPNVTFHALNRNESVTMELGADLEPTVGLWSNYPMTVCRRVARNFPGVTGADIAMSSDLPPASGLSSSSAMVIGTFLMLSAVNHLPFRSEYRQNITSTEDLAAYLGCCENGQTFCGLAGDRGVGTFGGSQDHTAILCCKPGKLSTFSFCPVMREQDVELPSEVRFLVASSGISAEKTGYAMAKYNSVAQRAAWLVQLWNKDATEPASCLRAALQSSRGAVAEMRRILKRHAGIDRELQLTSRLDQFSVESSQLIPDASNAVRHRQWSTFGELVDQSQMLAETALANQIPETIFLQRRLRSGGALAASAFGAGFGGSVWALVRDESISLEGTWAFTSKPSCPVVMLRSRDEMY
jgi:galactokinase